MRELVLAVDTTHEHGSLALADGATLLEERELHAPGGFGQVLYEELEALLARHAARVQDCALFAGAAGPGSFTGVRIALTCVKGLAEVLGRPAIGISNLEALAEFGHQPRRACIVDARKSEVYAAVYGFEAMSETVLGLASFLEQLSPDTELIAMDFARLPVTAEALARFPLTVAPPAQASAIARLAWRKWRAGAAGDPAAVDANYIRRPEAEVLYRPFV